MAMRPVPHEPAGVMMHSAAVQPHGPRHVEVAVRIVVEWVMVWGETGCQTAWSVTARSGMIRARSCTFAQSTHAKFPVTTGAAVLPPGMSRRELSL
jgi:hypothetical protein